MRKPIAILLVLFLSGCNNMYNHFSVGYEGIWGWVGRGPAYDELIYSGTRDIGSDIWKHCRSCDDLGFIPFAIIDFPLEIAMDTITFPYDIYAWFQADELAVQAKLRSCRKRAEEGDDEAQYELGCCYYEGEGGVEQDRQEAVKWWRKAAKQGHAKAKHKLDSCNYTAAEHSEDLKNETLRGTMK